MAEVTRFSCLECGYELWTSWAQECDRCSRCGGGRLDAQTRVVDEEDAPAAGAVAAPVVKSL